MVTLKGSPNVITNVVAYDDKDLVELAGLHAYNYQILESVCKLMILIIQLLIPIRKNQLALTLKNGMAVVIKELTR